MEISNVNRPIRKMYQLLMYIVAISYVVDIDSYLWSSNYSVYPIKLDM